MDPVLGRLKVTAAHEFFHLVISNTSGMFASLPHPWWDEGMATFIEDEVFDEVNDYVQYLDVSHDPDAYYVNTRLPLNLIGGGYETSLFWKIMSEKYSGGGPTYLKAILPEMGFFTSPVGAVDDVLQQSGASVADAFQHMACGTF